VLILRSARLESGASPVLLVAVAVFGTPIPASVALGLPACSLPWKSPCQPSPPPLISRPGKPVAPAAPLVAVAKPSPTLTPASRLG
jgi:hypothetical protein